MPTRSSFPRRILAAVEKEPLYYTDIAERFAEAGIFGGGAFFFCCAPRTASTRSPAVSILIVTAFASLTQRSYAASRSLVSV